MPLTNATQTSNREDALPSEEVVSSILPHGDNDYHLQSIKSFYDKAGEHMTWAGRQYRRWLARYFLRLIPVNSGVLEVGCGDGELLTHLKHCDDITGVDVSATQVALAQARIPHGNFAVQSGEYLHMNRTFDYIILSETINQASDVQGLFERLRSVSHARTRLLLNFYNTAWRPLLRLATMLGFKAKQPLSHWLSPDDVKNLLSLAGWELVKQQKRILIPISLFGLDKVVNRFIAPLVPWLCLTTFQIARPQGELRLTMPSVSVIIPARNEEGNIHAAIKRMPRLGRHTEVIFVEGHSKDNTWEEIQRVAKEESKHWDIVTLQQAEIGRGNAVREAFEIAKGDILMILDADLTVPPEELVKFYEALASGKAEFCNGVRLMYPVEKQPMRFLNLCANNFFGRVFAWALDQPIKDTLCGTKVLFNEDYQRIAANRHYFGHFDPFGNFDLLFGADHLLLKIVDIPIRYRDHTDDTTNISYFRRGLLLMRMLLVAIRKLKLG
jgi:ubiquinone/menaquinone biosynthesis C-methylase UbiE